jgi:hypothetical protein
LLAVVVGQMHNQQHHMAVVEAVVLVVIDRVHHLGWYLEPLTT